MKKTSCLVERVTELESLIAHQDSTIEDLHEMVKSQWTEIQSLSQEIAKLNGQLLRIESEIEAAQSNEQAPPHY